MLVVKKGPADSSRIESGDSGRGEELNSDAVHAPTPQEYWRQDKDTELRVVAHCRSVSCHEHEVDPALKPAEVDGGKVSAEI
jgi:hypothetical protein